MPTWIRKEDEQPLPQSAMLETTYRRYCPDCRGFQPHAVREAGEDGKSRIVECQTCGGSDLFEFQPQSSRGWLMPPAFVKAVRGFARRRTLEIASEQIEKEREEAEG